jgi:hypothetical protein
MFVPYFWRLFTGSIILIFVMYYFIDRYLKQHHPQLHKKVRSIEYRRSTKISLSMEILFNTLHIKEARYLLMVNILRLAYLVFLGVVVALFF